MRALVAILAVVAATAVGVRLVQVHETSGEWRLVVTTQTPDRIRVLGRDYDRSQTTPTSSDPRGLEPRGETRGGGTILVPEELDGGTPLVIYVRDDDGRLWTYGLVGGP